MADDAQDSTVDDFDVPDSGQDTGTQNASTDATQTDSGPELPSDIRDALIHDGLPIIQGESELEASRRLSKHLIGKSSNYRRDTAEAKQAAREAAARVQELQANLRPLLMEHYNRTQQAQLEEQVAQIPPRDSPEYAVWLQEEMLRRDTARRQEEIRRGQQQQVAQANSEIQAQRAAIDASGYQKVAEGLGLAPGSQQDPEFTLAYEVLSNMAVDAARSYYPNANEDEINEFIAVSQQLDIRQAEVAGRDIRDVWKGRVSNFVRMLESRGHVTRVNGQQQTTAPANGSGNGNGNRNANGTFKPQAPAQTTAQRMQADAQAAQRRGPTAVPSSARPTQLAGSLLDPSAFESDEDYADAVMAGLLGNEEQRVAPNRRNR